MTHLDSYPYPSFEEYPCEGFVVKEAFDGKCYLFSLWTQDKKFLATGESRDRQSLQFSLNQAIKFEKFKRGNK